MDDEEAHHAHRHLDHLVGVRVIHLRAVLLERELVSVGLARLDVRLVDAADAVHSVRQDDAVPVDVVGSGSLFVTGCERDRPRRPRWSDRASGRCNPSS